MTSGLMTFTFQLNFVARTQTAILNKKLTWMNDPETPGTKINNDIIPS